MTNRPRGVRDSIVLALIAILLTITPASFPAAASHSPTLAASHSASAPQWDMAPIGQVGGMIYALEIQGNYAYVGIGTKLVIWDITNPDQPLPVGESGILSGVVRDIELTGGQAYVAVGQGGVHILDVSTPSSPVELGSFSTYGQAAGVKVSGNYAYVASIFDEFRIFDITDPGSPTETGHYAGIYVAEGLDVVGGYAYVASGGDGLQIIDVSDPTSPAWQGSYPSTYAREVIVSGDYAYLADGYGNPNFVVVNVSNPVSPSQAGSYAAPGEGYDLAMDGSTVYLATWDNGIRFIDVSSPTSPNEIGYYNTSGRAEGVAVAGGYAYIADTWDGAKVVDISNPATPSLAYAYHSAGEAWDVVVAGTIAYLGDRNNGFYTIDISDPFNPEIMSYYPQAWSGTSEVYLAISNNLLYIVDRDQLYLFNVSNPANPSFFGSYPSLTDPKGISIAGDYAYIADGENGLRVLDIQNPANISEAGSLDTPDDLTDLVLSGDYAYLADASQGLRVVDIRQPASPAEAGSFVPAGYSAGVAIAGHHAYLSAGWNGLRIINVSNPGTPTEVGFYDEIIGHALAATEGIAYVVASQFAATLQQLDVTDPLSPTLTAEYDLPLDSNRMKIADDRLYIAAGGGGLMIFQVPMQISLDEVRPHQGHSDWTNVVEIYGENLNANGTFSLLPPTPGLPITLEVTWVNSTHVTAVIPAGMSAGSYTLQVSNPDGSQAVLENAYQVIDSSVDTLYAYSDELWTGPVAPITYDETQLGLVIHRAGGSSDLTDLTVDFYDGDPNSGGDSLGSGSIAILPPNSFTSTTSLTWTPQTEGYHEIYARVNAAPPFTVHRSVWVMPPPLDLVPPTVNSVLVNSGSTDVSTQNMVISIHASDNAGGTGVGSIYIMEFDWNPNIGEWVPVNESGWLGYPGAPMNCSWTLNWKPGVKNIVVWAADRSGNISEYGYVAWMNFIPPAISINQGQVQMFSYWLTAGQTFSAQTSPSTGDPDLYLGNSSGWLAYSINTGTQADSVEITAASTELHTLAVYGWTTARYALSVSGAYSLSGETRTKSPDGNGVVDLPVPPSEQGAPNQRALPQAPTGHHLYLPILVR
jgi:hypothetical protein